MDTPPALRSARFSFRLCLSRNTRQKWRRGVFKEITAAERVFDSFMVQQTSVRRAKVPDFVIGKDVSLRSLIDTSSHYDVTTA